MSEWIPVAERLPERDGDPVLIYTPHNKYGRVWVDQWITYREAPVGFSSATIETGEGWREHDDEDEVTHWMPLPQPPEER